MNSIFIYKLKNKLFKKMANVNKQMKYEKNYAHSWDILKKETLFKKPVNEKLLTYENFNNKPFSDTIKLNVDKYINDVNYSFNFLRQVFVILDLSDIDDKKINDDFLNKIFYILKVYIKEYFKHNLTSTLTVITSDRGGAEIFLPCITNNSFNEETIILKSCVYKAKLKKAIINKFSLTNAINIINDLTAKLSDSYSREILIISDNNVTYDNSALNEGIMELKHNKFQINVICLETPISLFKELTDLTNGFFFSYLENKNPEERDKRLHKFLKFYINKKNYRDDYNFYFVKCKLFINGKELENWEDINFEESKEKQKIKMICNCHNKENNILFLCAYCKEGFCQIPFYCARCRLVNFDEVYFNLFQSGNYIKNSNEHSLLKEDCKPYKFFLYYNNYENNDDYLSNTNKAINDVLAKHKKELYKESGFQKNTPFDYSKSCINFKFKMMLTYLKFYGAKKDSFFDIRKIKKFNNYIEFIESIKSFILRDNYRCAGCNKYIEINNENDLNDLVIYSNCMDIYCKDCYKYLFNFDLGCLECS